MPRHRRPIESRLLDGTYKPSLHGPLPPDAGEVVPPKKPRDLKGDAGKFWDYITGLLTGVVRERDAPLIAEMCWHWSELRRIKKAIGAKNPGEQGYNQLLIAVGICTDKFDKIAARFGLTPADRAKLSVESAGPARARVPAVQKSSLNETDPV